MSPSKRYHEKRLCRYWTKIIFLYFVAVAVYSPQWCIASDQLSFVGADGTPESFTYVKDLSNAGMNFFGLEQVRWHYVEPAAPRKKGTHDYDWSKLDPIIKKIENVDGSAFITIVCSSRWATREKSGSRVASPPEDDRWDDYRDFVEALVERYDKDGHMDMPGLKFAHLHFQIEDEAENPSSWSGSEEEYLKLLRTAREAAKKANPNVKIFTFSPNFGDFFDHLTPAELQDRLRMLNQTERKPAGKKRDVEGKGAKKARKVNFVKTVFEAEGAYDFIAVQYNYHYTGLPGIIAVIRKFSSKPIWVADSASATLLGRHQKVESEYDERKYPYLTEKEIGSILSNYGHSKYKEISEWWEVEKARTTFKKIVTAASLGAEHIFMQFILDLTSRPLKGDETGINPWNFAGLLEGNGDLRPVTYTIKLFHEKFSDFSRVEDLSKKEGTVSDWIRHYRFHVGEKVLDILWTDGDKKEYSFGSNGGRFRITRIIERKVGWPPKSEPFSGGTLIIDRIPIIVEQDT
jgi:hypothetical protein